MTNETKAFTLPATGGDRAASRAVLAVLLCVVLLWPLIPAAPAAAHHDTSLPPEKILVNQSGYNLGQPKRFTAPLAVDGTAYAIKRAADGSVVHEGFIYDHVGDFSSFNPSDAGEYFIEAGDERSVPFSIGHFWMEKVSYQPALDFMIDSRSWLGDVTDSTHTGVGWRDSHQFSFEVSTLVMQYLSNPSVYERMPRQLSYGGRYDTPVILNGLQNGARRDAGNVGKVWSSIPPELAGMSYLLANEADRSYPPFEDYVMYNVRSEREVTVYAIVDSARLPNWLDADGWEATGWTAIAENGETSAVYERTFAPGVIDLKRGLQGKGTAYAFDEQVAMVEAPDIVELIRYGAEIIYVQNGKHTLLKEQLAYFLYAYPYLKNWISEETYRKILNYTVSQWGDPDKGTLYWHDHWHASTPHTADLFQVYTQIGTIKGELPPGHSVVPNLLMHEIAQREGLAGAGRYFEAAYKQTEWLIANLDWRDPNVTKGQRMSEHVTVTGLAHFLKKYPKEAPPGLKAKLMDWANVMIGRSDNMWDFRKYSDEQWVPIELFPHSPLGWNEPGNVAGFPAPALAVAELIGEGRTRDRLVEMAMSHLDHTFGRNPYNRHFSHDANRDFSGLRIQPYYTADLDSELDALFEQAKGTWLLSGSGTDRALQSSAPTATTDDLAIIKEDRAFKEADKYTFQADFLIDTGGSAAAASGGLVFRYRDANNFYHFRLNKTGAGARQIQWLKWVDGTAVTLKTENLNWADNEWVNLKVAMDGSGFKFYVDDLPVLEGTDTSHAAGTAGFRNYGTTAKAKNISIGDYALEHEVEYGWFDEYIGGYGKLQGARGVLDGSPKNHAYPYNPTAARGYTEGWIAFNTAWNASLSYLTAYETELSAFDAGFATELHAVEPDTTIGIRLKAPLNFDYDRVEQGRLVLQSDTGDRETVTVTEASANSEFFTAAIAIEEGAALPEDGRLQAARGGWFTAAYGYGDYRTELKYEWDGTAFVVVRPEEADDAGIYGSVSSSTAGWTIGSNPQLRVSLTNLSAEAEAVSVSLELPGTMTGDRTSDTTIVQPHGSGELVFNLHVGPRARSAVIPITVSYGAGQTLNLSYTAVIMDMKTERDKRFDFSNGYTGEWQDMTGEGSTVELDNGEYAFRHHVSNNTTYLVLTQSGAWHDVAVQADIQINGAQNAFLSGLVFRSQNMNNYYSLRLNKTSAGEFVVDLLKVSGGNASVLQAVPYTWEPGNWYTIRAEARGDRLLGYVDGELVIDVTDGSFSSGGIGVRTYARQEVEALLKNIILPESVSFAATPYVFVDELLKAEEEAQALLDGTAVGAEPGNVDQASFEALLQEQAEAASVLNDRFAEQPLVDARLMALQAAIERFKAAIIGGSEVNRGVLAALLSEAKQRQEEAYTEASWQLFAAALAHAAEVLDDMDASQAAVNEAVARLTEALGALEPREQPGAPVWLDGRLSASALDRTSVTLHWSGANDEAQVTQYRIDRDGVPGQPLAAEALTVTASVYSYTITGLQPSTTYRFAVQAGNEAGLWSVNGPGVHITTLPRSGGGDGGGHGGNGGGSGGIAQPPQEPETDKDVRVVAELELKPGADGAIAIALESGQTAVRWPAAAARLDERTVLRIAGTGIVLELPAAILGKLADRANGEEIEFMTTSVKSGPLSNEQHLALGSELKAVGGAAYALEASMRLISGVEIRADQWHPGVRIALEYDEATVDAQLAGVYRFDEAKSVWIYAGSIADARSGAIAAYADQPGIYAVLERHKRFDDVANTHWAYRALQVLSAKHVVNGVGETEFAPSGVTTRAEFTALLVRALGLRNEGGDAGEAAVEFADVSANAWYAGEVAAAYRAGLVQGVSEDRFAPQAHITREQMAVMIMRAYEYANGRAEPAGAELNRYADRGELASWAADAAGKAVAAGLMQGTAADRFNPRGNATRAQTAQAVYNILMLLQ
ncbi:S-layer homology domain-containing protein [Paenibacillaceae bacterium WGS1546]|uniref:S-layer homology domain-containing protein n=1 Tax=Cohnella sp. WGS1546 TaxID=3366810 RepID=UPI00372D0B5D